VSPEQTRQAWEALLTALEQDVVRDSATRWSEPAGLGPMPRDLMGRASRLLAAQRDRLGVLEGERRTVAEHLTALGAIYATREPRGSVYLDTSA